MRVFVFFLSFFVCSCHKRPAHNIKSGTALKKLKAVDIRVQTLKRLARLFLTLSPRNRRQQTPSDSGLLRGGHVHRPECRRLHPPECLRLISFNIHAWRDANHDDNFLKLVELLRSLQPDVLCLNEVLHPFTPPPACDPYWEAVQQRQGHGYKLPPEAVPSSSKDALLSRLSEELGLPHVAFGAATECGFFGKVPFGNCILSRHELVDVQNSVYVASESDLHLGVQTREPEDLEDRSLTTAIVKLPGGLLLGVACTHLDHKAEEMREQQICHFLRKARAAFGDTMPWVLCGDLNTFDVRDMAEADWRAICELYASRGWPPPWSHSLVRRAMEAGGLEDAFILQQAIRPCKPPPTSWTATRIDYVMVSHGHEAVSHPVLNVCLHKTIPSNVSDHFPVVCDFELHNATE